MKVGKPFPISVIFNGFILTLLFSQIVCTQHSIQGNEKEHQITEETVSELNKHNETSVENHDATVSNLVKYIKQAWQHLDDDLYPPGEAQKLKKNMAGLLFHFKNRHCESLDKTFFNGQCRHIGYHYHCPDSLMALYDGPNNEGSCDCRDDLMGNNGLPSIYSNHTGKCHFQNTQGPCKLGEWFVIKNKLPVCETIPDGCSADGRHVYAKLNGTDDPPTCWNTRSNDQCPKEQTVRVEQNVADGELTVYCSCYLKNCNPHFNQPDEPLEQNRGYADATAAVSLANKIKSSRDCRVGKRWM